LLVQLLLANLSLVAIMPPSVLMAVALARKIPPLTLFAAAQKNLLATIKKLKASA
jgi:hypothetical protein